MNDKILMEYFVRICILIRNATILTFVRALIKFYISSIAAVQVLDMTQIQVVEI